MFTGNKGTADKQIQVRLSLPAPSAKESGQYSVCSFMALEQLVLSPPAVKHGL